MKSRRKGTKKNKRTRRKRGGMETNTSPTRPNTPPTRPNTPRAPPFIPPIALPPPAIHPLPTITSLNVGFQTDSMEDIIQFNMRQVINGAENYAPRILQILTLYLRDYQERRRSGHFTPQGNFEGLLSNDVDNFTNYINNQNQGGGARKKRGAGGVFSCTRCGKKDKNEGKKADYYEDGIERWFSDSGDDDDYLSGDDDDDLPEWVTNSIEATQPVFQPMKHYQNLSLVQEKNKRPTSPFLPLEIQKATRLSPLLDDDGVVFGQLVNIEEYKGGRKKKTRKYKGNKYPYKNITKKEAIADFIKLKTTTNPRSLNGLEIVNYGTEKLRVRTKYRGKSLIQRWKDKKARKTLKKFANRLYKGSYTDSLLHAYRSAIALSWGTLSSMRTSAALQMYKKYNAKKVLDFTAGWGSRMTAALAADIDYIGIDSNKSLKKGYNKIIKTVKKHTKSKVKLFFQPAETVNYSKLDYDFVFTSPPYEYLELYEHMKNYEGTKKIKQAHSANDKRRKNDGFYDTFLIPTIKEIYKHLPKGKWMCLNVPDLMYDKIKKKWKACNKKEDYMISKRVGSNMKSDDRRGQEFVYCWKK